MVQNGLCALSVNEITVRLAYLHVEEYDAMHPYILPTLEWHLEASRTSQTIVEISWLFPKDQTYWK